MCSWNLALQCELQREDLDFHDAMYENIKQLICINDKMRFYRCWARVADYFVEVSDEFANATKA